MSDLKRLLCCLVFLGQAASIADMCITPDEFLQRVGDFGQYCPVSLADKNELIDCSTNVTLKYAAEFRGLYSTFTVNAIMLVIIILNQCKCINNALVRIYAHHAQKTYKMIIKIIVMILLSLLLAISL